jgi:hypothetical protein
VPHIAGPALEEGCDLSPEERLVVVAVDGKLACGLLELKTQIRHFT